VVESDQPAPLEDIAYTLPGSDNDRGTVKPPPDKIKTCKRGTFSIGGGAVIKVKRLAPHYCLIAVLVRRSRTPGSIPAGAGQILSDVTLFQVTYKNHLVKSLPANDGHVELCYAVPPGKTAKIYQLDFGKHSWKSLSTTVKHGVACARIRASGVYVLIGK
jgi:hypothetical protein